MPDKPLCFQEISTIGLCGVILAEPDMYVSRNSPFIPNYLIFIWKGSGELMIKICAWCRQDGQSETRENPSLQSDAQISHGICRYHELRLRLQYRRSLLQSAFLANGRNAYALPH